MNVNVIYLTLRARFIVTVFFLVFFSTVFRVKCSWLHLWWSNEGSIRDHDRIIVGAISKNVKRKQLAISWCYYLSFSFSYILQYFSIAEFLFPPFIYSAMKHISDWSLSIDAYFNIAYTLLSYLYFNVSIKTVVSQWYSPERKRVRKLLRRYSIAYALYLTTCNINYES